MTNLSNFAIEHTGNRGKTQMRWGHSNKSQKNCTRLPSLVFIVITLLVELFYYTRYFLSDDSSESKAKTAMPPRIHPAAF